MSLRGTNLELNSFEFILSRTDCSMASFLLLGMKEVREKQEVSAFSQVSCEVQVNVQSTIYYCRLSATFGHIFYPRREVSGFLVLKVKTLRIICQAFLSGHPFSLRNDWHIHCTLLNLFSFPIIFSKVLTM